MLRTTHLPPTRAPTAVRLSCDVCVVLMWQMMRVEVTKYNKRFGIVKMNAKGYVGTELAVEAQLTLAMGKASAE